MKNLIFTYLIIVVTAWTAWGQSAEPAVSGANFVPATVGVGQTSTLTVSFANTGSTEILSGAIEVTISLAKDYYMTNGATPPAGPGGALFNWMYIGADVWRGTNKTTIPAFGGGNITLEVTGKAVSNAFELTNVNVQPINNFATFNDSPNNNNVQPRLKVETVAVPEVDLALKKTINKKIATIGDTVTYSIKVWNQSLNPASGVEVTDSLSAGLSYLSSSAVRIAGGASAGTYNAQTSKWTIGNVAASGDTVVLTLKAKVTGQGVIFNKAEISAINEKDKDSTPNNGIDGEDDIDRQCFTVPIKLCANERVQASVPSRFTNVQWFKQGSNVVVASGNEVLLSEPGTYSYTANNTTCPATGCCPIIIESGNDCCSVQTCVPVTFTKKNK